MLVLTAASSSPIDRSYGTRRCDDDSGRRNAVTYKPAGELSGVNFGGQWSKTRLPVFDPCLRPSGLT